ncbi:RraA family protein [Pararoseomonas indoligenes]|uniref:Putative 4-hydroxy-4-methyl-2-oxoglutarate aldolase n=1 Tax=Roseomonas indoligenes TaxID=2820811 RepID=A0A940S5T7_9PROT|nr:RraA family protein [Pararoseomonas indoligenes]MBP0491337.1 RraA family protein [Pararoseomonas indoligenes]
MARYVTGAPPPSLDPAVVALLEKAETATIGHWRHWGFVDRRVAPLLPRRRVAGTAFTVMLPANDGTMLAHALDHLRPGDVLVVDRLGDRRHACIGGGLAVAAQAAGAVAAVVDGPCTDLEEIEEAGFPVWCRGLAPVTTQIFDMGGAMNVPVSIGGAVVMPGDAVICDNSGVLVLPPGEAEAEARRAIETQARGAETARRVAAGELRMGVVSGATARVTGG